MRRPVPWKIAVSLMGLVVVLISITGVLVWWRKRWSTERSRAGRFQKALGTPGK